MERISNRINSMNNNIIQLPPPPPYTAVVFKLDENEFDIIPPPAYSDVDSQSVTYINNYPGPPLIDGHVQAIQDTTSINLDTIISKKICIYLMINGIIAVLFGIISIGIQIGILALNSTVYYYGFWGGVIIIAFGISNITLYKHHRSTNYFKLFYSFSGQMILVSIVFVIGIVIIVTDTCSNHSCTRLHKILDGCLCAIFALAFLQSIINTMVFGILKRQQPTIPNSQS